MDGSGEIGQAAAANVNSAFFETLGQLPWTGLTSVIAIILVVLYFVSGADANTFVLSMLTSRGTLEPSRWVLTVWGALTGTTAMVLFFAGGLAALQQAAMLSALPFAVIVALLGICIVKTLHEDHTFDAYRTVRRRDLEPPLAVADET